MIQSSQNYKTPLANAILHYIWRSWDAIGLAGNLEPATSVIVDPEALLLLTCSVGRCDQRLFDEVIDWITHNWELLNINRVKNMRKKYKWSGDRALTALAGWLIEHQGHSTKWKSLAHITDETTIKTPLFMHRDGSSNALFGKSDSVFMKYGFIRGEVKLRGYSRTPQQDIPTSLLLSLRSFFGTNIRAEIITYLLAHKEGAHPSKIANETSYDQKSVQNALACMKKSPWIHCNENNFEKTHTLTTDIRKSFKPKNKKIPKWLNLPPIYCLIETVWQKINDQEFTNLSYGIQSIELKEAIAPFEKMINNPVFTPSFSTTLKGKTFLDTLIKGIIDFTEDI